MHLFSKVSGCFKAQLETASIILIFNRTLFWIHMRCSRYHSLCKRLYRCCDVIYSEFQYKYNCKQTFLFISPNCVRYNHSTIAIKRCNRTKSKSDIVDAKQNYRSHKLQNESKATNNNNERKKYLVCSSIIYV